MPVKIVAQQEAEYSRSVEEFMRDFTHQTGHTVELVDPDSVSGATFITSYGIMEYPTVLAVTENDGSVQSMWSGLPLPTISEVSYYA